MIIVDRRTFLGMPNGTVYRKCAPCGSALAIKTACLPNDWICVELTGFSLDEDDAMINGASISLDPFGSRDGCFDGSETFVVFGKEDVTRIIDMLAATTK